MTGEGLTLNRWLWEALCEICAAQLVYGRAKRGSREAELVRLGLVRPAREGRLLCLVATDAGRRFRKTARVVEGSFPVDFAIPQRGES